MWHYQLGLQQGWIPKGKLPTIQNLWQLIGYRLQIQETRLGIVRKS